MNKNIFILLLIINAIINTSSAFLNNDTDTKIKAVIFYNIEPENSKSNIIERANKDLKKTDNTKAIEFFINPHERIHLFQVIKQKYELPIGIYIKSQADKVLTKQHFNLKDMTNKGLDSQFYPYYLYPHKFDAANVEFKISKKKITNDNYLWRIDLILDPFEIEKWLINFYPDIFKPKSEESKVVTELAKPKPEELTPEEEAEWEKIPKPIEDWEFV